MKEWRMLKIGQQYIFELSFIKWTLKWEGWDLSELQPNHCIWVTKFGKVHLFEYTFPDLVTQARVVIFLAHQSHLYTSNILLIRAVVSTALRGVQLFLTVPLVSCAGIFLKEIASETTGYVLNPYCKHSQGGIRQADRGLFWSSHIFWCHGTGYHRHHRCNSILIKYLNRAQENLDGWGNILVTPQETTAQRIASCCVSLAVVVGIYWYLTVS